MDLAGESVWCRDAIADDRGLPVLAHIGSFVSRENEGLRAIDATLGDFPVIDKDRACSSLAEPAAVIGKLEPDR